MPFQPGNRANPGGRPKDQLFTDRLRMALLEDDKKAKRRKLDLVVDSLVANAIAGESWAVTQIADRLDGKPHQTSEVTHNTKSVTEMTRDELLRIAAQDRVESQDAEETKH
jgi:hypothetical protein